jgi:2-polyprenyl-3-methyl-5-hydroxy-6-metoxy-1,4-benzoquinol methylase
VGLLGEIWRRQLIGRGGPPTRGTARIFLSTDITSKKILDVGCGWNKTPGAIGIDSNPKTHADVIHDLGDIPYPFADDEFDEIVCRHVVEHVPNVMGFVTEIYRIAKPGGRITIVTPHYSNPDWALIQLIAIISAVIHSTASLMIVNCFPSILR